jgi:hypothetical protein
MSSLSRILYPISASDGHPSGVTIIHQYLITGSESLYIDRYPITSLSFSHSVNSGVYSVRRSISATNPSLPAMMLDTKTYQLPPTGEIEIVHEQLAIAYTDGITTYRSDPQLSTMSHTLPQADHV